MRVQRIALVASLTTSVGGYGATAWIDLAHRGRVDMSAPEVIATGTAVLVTGLLGGLVLRSRPGHRVGLILVGMSLVGTVTTFLEVYAFAGLVNPGSRLPFDRAADVASIGSWVTAYAGLTALGLFFPDGRLPSPRCRRWVWAMGASFVLAWLAATLQPGRQDEPFASLTNPVGQAWLAGAGQAIVAVAMLSMLAAMATVAAAVADRYQASSGVERFQMKWLAYAVGLAPLALACCYLGNWFFRSEAAAAVALQAALVLIPAGVGIAVLRYRLYDIDRLINRTVVYGLLTAVLGLIYAAVSLAAGLAAGGGSAVPTAVATMVTVLAFRLVRARAQDLVDRRFSPARYRGRQLVASFVNDLRNDRVHPAAIEPVLAAALQVPTLRLGLWVPSHQLYVSPAGTRVEFTESDVRAAPRVEFGGAHHAVVVLPEGSRPAKDLETAVLSGARLALQVAALRAEVMVQSTDAAQARVQLLTAAFDERRRLEQDLHDGAQQRLVYLGIVLRRLQRSLPAQARILEPALNEAVAQVADALCDLRDIAQGARPGRLSKGLRAALADLAATTPLPVRLHLSSQDAPPEVEAVAYYVACEALTNAAKHANATEITVTTSIDSAGFCLTVRDDGVGGAHLATGRGLSGLRARVEHQQGVLAVSSRSGGGTTVKATLPCA